MTAYGHAPALLSCWCGRSAVTREDDRLLCARHAMELAQAEVATEVTT